MHMSIGGERRRVLGSGDDAKTHRYAVRRFSCTAGHATAATGEGSSNTPPNTTELWLWILQDMENRASIVMTGQFRDLATMSWQSWTFSNWNVLFLSGTRWVAP